MRSRSVLLPLLLAGCATPGPSPRPDAAASREAALLARYPQAARREGSLLSVARGGTSVPESYRNVDCGKTDTCSIYTLDAAWRDGTLLGIDVGLYEGASYIVADTRADHLVTGYKPVFAPDGRHFATAAYAEAHENGMEGVHLYAVGEASNLIRSVSPTAMAYTDGGTWLGNACFSFTAPMGGRAYTPDGRPAPHANWYLVEAEPEWRLTRDRDRVCTG